MTFLQAAFVLVKIGSELFVLLQAVFHVDLICNMHEGLSRGALTPFFLIKQVVSAWFTLLRRVLFL